MKRYSITGTDAWMVETPDGPFVEAETARELLEACESIVGLSAGWNESGSTGPGYPLLSWESVARIAMDIARAAIAKVEAK
jgi:CTP:molybdopterin cytidylyltransferase MocA